MDRSARQPGMHAEITRRDFLNGVGVAIGAAMAPCRASGAPAGRRDLDGYYPPELSGMRGSHPGSFSTIADAHGAVTELEGGS